MAGIVLEGVSIVGSECVTGVGVGCYDVLGGAVMGAERGDDGISISGSIRMVS